MKLIPLKAVWKADYLPTLSTNKEKVWQKLIQMQRPDEKRTTASVFVSAD